MPVDTVPAAPAAPSLQALPLAGNTVQVGITMTDTRIGWVDSSSVLALAKDAATGKVQAVVWSLQSNSLLRVRGGTTAGAAVPR